MKSQDRAGPGVPPTLPEGGSPRRRSRRGRALPLLGLAILAVLVVMGVQGALSASTLLFPAVLVTAAAWLAHILSRDEQ